MDSKIKDKLNLIFKGDKKVKIFVALGLISILVILLSEAIPSNYSSTSSNTADEVSYSDYIDDLESEAADLIGSIDGVGKCKVMLTLKDTNESIYAKNSDESNNDGSYSKSYEYVLYDSDNGEQPILVKQYFPQVQGVAIVCEGGDNTIVQERIISAVSSLFNISSSKISVSKLSQ